MYHSFKIENFRLFDQLLVSPLARINLVAGRNNVGKTALLEALWLHAGQNNPELVQRLNLWRGLPGSDPGELFADLFQGYQTNSPIKLSAFENGEKKPRTLTITHQPRTEIVSQIDVARLHGGRSPSESIFENELVFEYVDERGNQFPSKAWIETTQLPLDLTLPSGIQVEGNIAALRAQRGPTSADRSSSVFLQSVARIAPQELAARFGRAEVKRYLGDVEETLKLVEPRLQRLVAVPLANGPTLLYADVGAERILPVALMGSGFVRLMELTLAFAEVSDGSILIDEIENGLHYAVLQNVWQTIDQLSQKFKVQVFATTHSYECIKAAHAASSANEFADDLAVCPRNTNPHRVSSYLTRLLPKHFTDCRYQSM